MNLFLISIFLLFNTVIYSLAQVPGRFGTSCAYLSQKIYCFGGSVNLGENAISDSNLMYLDIVYSSGNSTKELADKWTNITPMTNNASVQPRDNPQSTVLPDGKTLLLSGGWNSDDSLLVSQTLAYNSDNNSWSVYTGYTEPPFGTRQIFYASSVYIPEYGIGYYGGFETNTNSSWTYKGKNMSGYDYPSGRQIGYTSLTFLDIGKTVNPWFVFSAQKNLPAVFSSGQTSVFDALSNRIFFFGGSYVYSDGMLAESYSFNTSVTFNVATGTWGSQILSGDFPTERFLHSTTLLSSTNRDVLLYGGESDFNNYKPCLDYLFTLNLDSYKWKQQYIPNSDGLDLARSQHSAVPIYNDTVFIIFGMNSAGVSVSSMIILNVTDPLNVFSLSTYVDPKGVNSSINETAPPNIVKVETPSSSLGLSTGAKVGITVGVVVGVLIIATAFFFLWKKNKDKKMKKEFDEIRRQNERIESPLMEVNWEAIDQKFAYPSGLVNRATTMVINKPEFHSGPNLVPEGLAMSRHCPDAIDDEVKSLSEVLQKPDSDH